MTKGNEVRIVGFATNPIRNFYAGVPEDYLSKSELPPSLVTALKINGWRDQDGNLWWDSDFRPDPVKGEDGNVYLLVGDVEMEFASEFQERMNKAVTLLNS